MVSAPRQTASSVDWVNFRTRLLGDVETQTLGKISGKIPFVWPTPNRYAWSFVFKQMANAGQE